MRTKKAMRAYQNKGNGKGTVYNINRKVALSVASASTVRWKSQRASKKHVFRISVCIRLVVIGS